MFKRLSISAGIMLLGSIITNAGKAEAGIYSFSDYAPPNGSLVSASGFFEINDVQAPIVEDAGFVAKYEVNIQKISKILHFLKTYYKWNGIN